MKNCYRAILSMTMAAAMTAMTACSGTPAPTTTSSGSDTPQTAMGRYVEQDCTLPQTPASLYGLAADNGAVSLFAAHEGSENMELFASDDNGETWSTKEQGLIEASGLTQLNDICRKPDGGILVAGEYFSPEFLVQLEAFQAAGGGYSEELDWPPIQLMDVSPDGTVREIPIELSPQAANNISNMAIAPSGELAVQSYNEVYRYDLTTGALLSTIKLESSATSIAFGGDKLIVMADGIATIYDFESGDPLETIDQLGFTRSTAQLNVSSSISDSTSLAAVGEDGAFYFCTSAGIYRKTADGGLVERIVDGSLVSLGTPSIGLIDMLVLPDGFLVVMQDTVNDSVMLKKYVFDPDVPTIPDKSLRIYSLTDSKSVRQAIGDYQLINPDTHVVLEVAPPELATADAVRALNTELLAGRGPDLLILDGIPARSYIDKGALLPLDDTVTQGTLTNITEAGRAADGKLYSVPTRFAIPAVTVDGTVPQFDSVTAIADAAVALAEKNKNTTVRMILQNCGGDVLLNTLYPVFEKSLQTDGKPDEAKLRSFLEQLQKITSLQDADKRFVTDDSPFATLDMQWTPLMWCTGSEVMGMGNLASYRDFANATTAVTRVPDSRLDYISPGGSRPFMPLTNLAICSGSGNVESATEFIKLALSQQQQEYDFRDGLPVNSATLEELLTYDEDNKPSLGAYGMTDENGETTAINIQYPSAEALEQLRSRIAVLDTPTGNDRVVLELIKRETAEYLKGAAELDRTMTTLWQKLKLLEAE